jgi:predicted SAM-dependent methyltransferase
MIKNRKLVNIGCGKIYHEDWINYDLHPSDNNIIKCDIMNGIPLDSKTVDVVYHSNILEHLHKEKAEAFLHECHRILKPKGIIRIAIPDLEQLCRNYLTELEVVRKINPSSTFKYQWAQAELIDQMTRNTTGGVMKKLIDSCDQENIDFLSRRIGIFQLKAKANTEKQNVKQQRTRTRKVLSHFKHRILSLKHIKSLIPRLSSEEKKLIEVGRFYTSGEHHKWMYDEYSLNELLSSTGFIETKKMEHNKSLIQKWEDYYLEVDKNKNIIKPDSIVLEGRKQ